jgi:hypothetical protein
MTAVTRTTPPESLGALRAWERRRRQALAVGVGGDQCETGTDAIQLAYATGEEYGIPHPPCDPCRDLMASWGTRPVGTTGYFRLPARAAHADLKGSQSIPGVPTSPHAASTQIEDAA